MRHTAHQLRELIVAVVDELMADNGDATPILACVEPDIGIGTYEHVATGIRFDLAPAINQHLWAKLLDVYEED